MITWIIIQGPQGTRRVAENTPYRLEKGERVIGSEIASDGKIGLGDVVATVTNFFGIKPCAPCNRRRRRLNEIRLPRMF